MVDLRKHWGKALILAVCVLAAFWLFSDGGKATREMLVAWVRGLPAFWFFIAFTALPLIGFPISPLLVLAGVRFGFGAGMAVAAAGIAIQHCIAFPLAHGRPRKWLGDRLATRGYSIPSPSEKNHVWFTAVFTSIHGPPYAAKLYLLALTSIPFRIYFGIGAPVYILFCVIPVGAGGSAIAVNPLWLYGGLAAVTILALLAGWLRRRSRSEFHRAGSRLR